MRSLITALVLLAWLQDGQGLRENPEYQRWAACKPGSWVEYRDELVGEPHPPDHRTTFTLVESTPDKIVIDIRVKLRGKEEESTQSRRYEIPSRIKPDGRESAGTGEEEIQVGDKRLKCSWELWQTSFKGKKSSVKLWLHQDIPGRLAREESRAEGQFDSVRRALRWEMK